MDNPKDDHILITGGTGLVGSYVVRKLVSKGYTQITALHRKTSTFDLLGQEIQPQVNFVEQDLTDPHSLSSILNDVDIIIHCAGMISFWPQEYKQMYEINHLATERLVQAAANQGVRRFIHLSSVEALGRQEHNGLITEESIFQGDKSLSQYASSKHQGELAVKAAEIESVILYPGLILGGGFWTAGPLQIFRDIYKGLKFYPKGSIGIVDVRDVVELIVQMLHPVSFANERYIVVAENIDHLSLFTNIANSLGISPPYIALNDLLGRMAITVEAVKAKFTKSKPLINREMYEIASLDLCYSNKKILEATNFQFRKIEETISETSECFLNSFPHGRAFGTLSMNDD